MRLPIFYELLTHAVMHSAPSCCGYHATPWPWLPHSGLPYIVLFKRTTPLHCTQAYGPCTRSAMGVWRFVSFGLLQVATV